MNKKKVYKSLAIFASIVLLLNQNLSLVSFAQEPPPPPPGSEAPPPPPPPPQVDPTSTPAPTEAPNNTNNTPTATPTNQPTNGAPSPSEQPPNPYETPTPTPTQTNQTNTTPSLTPTPTPIYSETNSGLDPYGSTLNSTALNSQTGIDSTNTSNIDNSNTSTVSSNNNAYVDNSIGMVVNSGDNRANYNTAPGTVQTGDTTAGMTLTNNLNSNITGTGGFKTLNVTGDQTGDIIFSFADNNLNNSFNNGTSGESYSQAGQQVAENSLTGASSTNDSNNTNTNSNTTTNTNDGNLVNNINIGANTGNNSASYNTYGGSIETGDATIAANIINFLNTNLNVEKWLVGVVNIMGDYIGNIILPQDTASGTGGGGSTQIAANNTTGANSTNNATTTNSNTHTFTNYNNADVVNNIETSALTGGNYASKNTGPGSVESGSSNVNVAQNTVANTNVDSDGTVWLVFVNTLGNWVGYILGTPPGSTSAASNGIAMTNSNGTPSTQTAGNSQTGANSQNSSTVNNSNTEVVSNSNDAKIINNINLTANTGNNTSSYNTMGGDVQSGNANIGLNLVNFVNTNIVAKKIVVLFVNVFGNWIGNVVPPGQSLPATPNPPPEPSSPPVAQGGSGSGNLPVPTSQPSPPNFQENNNSNSKVEINDVIVSNNTGQNIFISVNSSVRGVSSKKTTIYDELYGMEYSDYLGQTPTVFRRGLFVSPTFAKETDPTVAGKLFGGKDVITSGWLMVLIPLLFFFLIVRRKFVFLNFKVYLNKILEVIL